MTESSTAKIIGVAATTVVVVGGVVWYGVSYHKTKKRLKASFVVHTTMSTDIDDKFAEMHIPYGEGEIDPESLLTRMEIENDHIKATLYINNTAVTICSDRPKNATGCSILIDLMEERFYEELRMYTVERHSPVPVDRKLRRAIRHHIAMLLDGVR